MTRSLSFLLFFSLFLSACGAPGDLWGQPNPPASAAHYPVPLTETPALVVVTPFSVLPLPGTATPGSQPTPTFPPINTAGPMLALRSSGGESLNIIAARSGVAVSEILSDSLLPSPEVLLPPGQLLLLPNRLPSNLSPSQPLLPDAEIVYSPTALGFNTQDYVTQQNGYLRTYREYLASKAWQSGAQVLQAVATDNSINPRLLLALLEYQSGWVRGQPADFVQNDYPLGNINFQQRGYFQQLVWAASQLSVGYYGWRSGQLTELTFPNGSRLRLHPGLNAGSVALMYVFAQLYDQPLWDNALQRFPALYAEMFGDPWQRASALGPLLPAGLQQPPLDLPFEPGAVWSFSGGPHSAWEHEGAQAALDFAPASATGGCAISDAWVLAPASGLVARVDEGVLVLDLDGDGSEQTGWNLLFLHLANKDKPAQGARLQKDDRLGHPSCTGGVATGTHLHLVRKFNGEWALAAGPLGFNLGGWRVLNGEEPYKGSLFNGAQRIEACACGSYETRISRPK